MEGLRRVVNDAKHRKEVVASGLAQYLIAGTLMTLKLQEFTDLCWQSIVAWLVG
jgi:hypothetical protein